MEEEPVQEIQEPVQEIQEQEPSQEEQEEQEEPFQEVRKQRGRPRMTPEQKREAKAARDRLKVVAAPAPKKETKPKIIERVVREYVEVPTPAVQQSPFESIGNLLKNQALSNYERKKQQWASFQLI
jgi:TolA-binding protein